MKEPYETPKMVTEKIEEMGSLVASSGTPIAALIPFFGLCPPCAEYNIGHKKQISGHLEDPSIL